jgi:cytochrome c
MLLASCQQKQQPLKTESAAEETALTPIEQGQILFDNRGSCFSCHNPDDNTVGPSIKEIADIYRTKKGDMVSFLQGEADPIVDPARYSIMKTNLPITKSMTEAELKAIEAYILSH